MSNIKAKLLEKITISDTGCWLWTGYVAKNGYGQISHNKKSHKAHRLVFEEFQGPIPDGLELDHICRVRNCVNPDHLQPVTKRENILRGVGFSAVNHKKTACPKGHPYSEENTYTKPSGHRICKICRKEQYNDMYAKRKDQILARQKARKNKTALEST